MEQLASPRQRPTPQAYTNPEPATPEVQLHVYDVSKDEKIGSINRWLAPRSSPLKFGGVFHAGVEVRAGRRGLSLCAEVTPSC